VRAGSLSWMHVLSVIVALGGCGGGEKRTEGGKVADDDGAGDKPRCEAICARSEAAACDQDPGDCAVQCAALTRKTPARCAAQLSAFTRCAATASFTCDVEGASHAPACDPQLDAWLACVDLDDETGSDGPSLDGGAPDARTPRPGVDASHAECPLEDVENVCSTCLKFSCCDQISACGPACQALVACVNACPPSDTSDTCGQACIARHPDGASAFTAFAQCIGVQCEAACSTSVVDASVPPTDDAPGTPGDCLPRGSVPAGHCDPDDSRPHAWECAKQPPGCVPSPSGVRDIYCCG
jgi:hypothetical protein